MYVYIVYLYIFVVDVVYYYSVSIYVRLYVCYIDGVCVIVLSCIMYIMRGLYRLFAYIVVVCNYIYGYIHIYVYKRYIYIHICIIFLDDIGNWCSCFALVLWYELSVYIKIYSSKLYI